MEAKMKRRSEPTSSNGMVACLLTRFPTASCSFDREPLDVKYVLNTRSFIAENVLALQATSEIALVGGKQERDRNKLNKLFCSCSVEQSRKAIKAGFLAPEAISSPASHATSNIPFGQPVAAPITYVAE